VREYAPGGDSMRKSCESTISLLTRNRRDDGSCGGERYVRFYIIRRGKGGSWASRGGRSLHEPPRSLSDALAPRSGRADRAQLARRLVDVACYRYTL